MNWTPPQSILFDCESDVLVLLDCCYAANTARVSDTQCRGTNEIIAAYSQGVANPGAASQSFTTALVDELGSRVEDIQRGKSLTAVGLHSALFRYNRKLQYPPSYVRIAGSEGPTIELTPSPSTYVSASKTLSPHSPTTVVPTPPEPEARVLLAIHTAKTPGGDVVAFLRNEGLCHMYVKGMNVVNVEAVYKSDSTLVVVSVPMEVWNFLPDNPACQFIGTVRSGNIIQNAAALEPCTDRDEIIEDWKDVKISPWAKLEALHSPLGQRAPPAQFDMRQNGQRADSLSVKRALDTKKPLGPQYVAPASGPPTLGSVGRREQKMPARFVDEVTDVSSLQRSRNSSLKRNSDHLVTSVFTKKPRQAEETGPRNMAQQHAYQTLAQRPSISPQLIAAQYAEHHPTSYSQSDAVAGGGGAQDAADALLSLSGRDQKRTLGGIVAAQSTRTPKPSHSYDHPDSDYADPHSASRGSGQKNIPRLKIKPPKSSPTTRRPFICSFARYGCKSSLGSKNEWKRHVTGLDMQLGYYRCDVSTCDPSHEGPKPSHGKNGSKTRSHNDFNRKDLFIQHQRRMHAPWLPAKNPATQLDRKKFEATLEELCRRCWVEQRKPPEKSVCGFCNASFEGPQSWDERMEHVAKHLSAGDGGEKEDPGLRTYLLKEGLIERVVPGDGFGGGENGESVRDFVLKHLKRDVELRLELGGAGGLTAGQRGGSEEEIAEEDGEEVRDDDEGRTMFGRRSSRSSGGRSGGR